MSFRRSSNSRFCFLRASERIDIGKLSSVDYNSRLVLWSCSRVWIRSASSICMHPGGKARFARNSSLFFATSAASALYFSRYFGTFPKFLWVLVLGPGSQAEPAAANLASSPVKTMTSGSVGFFPAKFEFVRLVNLSRFDDVNGFRAEGGRYWFCCYALPLRLLKFLPKATCAGSCYYARLRALVFTSSLSYPEVIGTLGMPPPRWFAVPGLPEVTLDSTFWNFFITNRSAEDNQSSKG